MREEIIRTVIANLSIDMNDNDIAVAWYQARTLHKARRVVAKVERHLDELYPRVGFVVTNLSR